MPELISRLNAALAGHYRIERELGEGGMATVYLAHDLKHERQVALKVLKAELAAIVGAERFLAEIKTTANLHHPHILPLHDSGDAEGFLYYVMPYVQGESLRQRLDREHQLPVDEAVRIATNVAEALDYAHRQGVVHRDIKPENILLQDGRPVVADFGVALAVSAAGGERLTKTGLAVGTPGYMSPEQITGDRKVTPRSDIYALGTVLYELLAGEPPHAGSTARSVIAKILTEDPRPLQAVRKSVTPEVAAATAKSLEKVPADRFRTAADFAAGLQGRLVLAPPSPTGEAAGGGETSRVPLTLATSWILVAVLAAALGASMLRDTSAGPGVPVVRFTIPVPQGHALLSGWPNLDISPDGRTVVYTAADTLFKRLLDGTAPVALLAQAGVCCPAFSPDGQWIFLGRGGVRPGGRGVSVDGGPLVDLENQIGAYLAVHSTATGGGILIHTPREQGWEQVTVVDTLSNEGAHMWPQLLPDRNRVLFTSLGSSLMWDQARIVIQDLDSGERRTVVEGASYGRYLPTGHVAYVDGEGTMHAVPFDLDRMEVTGSPLVIESSVRTAYWAGGASVAISETGTLVYVKGSSLQNHRLTWVNRAGQVVGVVGDPYTLEGIRISPNGRYGVSYVASATSDIGLFDLDTGDMRRLTFDDGNEDNPVWSADGQRVAYHLVKSGRDHRIYVRDAFGGADPRLVHSTAGYVAPRSWSPDGNHIVAWEGGALVVVDLQDGSVDTVTTQTDPAGGRISPDGRWLAYTSSESGRHEVYVAAFPGLGDKRLVSRSGGRVPDWSLESDELFFISGDTLMVSDVTTGDTFSSAPPRPLFVSEDFTSLDLWYGVSPDGQRFLYPAANPEAPAREIHVVVNWFQELRGR